MVSELLSVVQANFDAARVCGMRQYQLHISNLILVQGQTFALRHLDPRH